MTGRVPEMRPNGNLVRNAAGLFILLNICPSIRRQSSNEGRSARICRERDNQQELASACLSQDQQGLELMIGLHRPVLPASFSLLPLLLPGSTIVPYGFPTEECMNMVFPGRLRTSKPAKEDQDKSRPVRACQGQSRQVKACQGSSTSRQMWQDAAYEGQTCMSFYVLCIYVRRDAFMPIVSRAEQPELCVAADSP